MANLKYEIKAKSGTYKNKSGEEKPNWVKMGVVFESEKGLSIKIESIPVGWDGWASLFVPKPKETIQNDPFADVTIASNNISAMDDDIPF